MPSAPPEGGSRLTGQSDGRFAPAAHRITAEDRVERIGQLTTRQLTDALLWLAGYAPDVFDVVADAVEPFAGDGSEDPAPFCAVCGGTSACSSSSAWIGGIIAAPTSLTWSCSSRGTGPSWPGHPMDVRNWAAECCPIAVP
jgi:hypothetical protein